MKILKYWPRNNGQPARRLKCPDAAALQWAKDAMRRRYGADVRMEVINVRS